MLPSDVVIFHGPTFGLGVTARRTEPTYAIGIPLFPPLYQRGTSARMAAHSLNGSESLDLVRNLNGPKAP